MARTTPVNSGYTIINGTATGSNASIVNVWLEWKQLSTDIDKNQSQVRVLLYAQCTGSSSTSWTVADKFGYVSCDGTAQYRSTTYNFANKAVNCFGDYTFTVSHDTDGSKSVTLAGAFTTKSSYISGGSVSAKVTLDTIPRASSFGTITGTTLGGTMRVNINRASSSFTHKVHYHRGNNVWGGNVSGTTFVDVPLPIDLAELSPDSKQFDLLLLLRTYSGSTQIGGDVKKHITVTIPENEDTRPVVAMNLTPDSPFEGVYVQGLSKVQADISAEGKLGADIESYGLTVDGRSCGGSLVSGTLSTSGEIVVTGSATDSRGIVGTTSQAITVLPYYKPRLIGVKAYRVKVTEVETEDGEPQRKIQAADDGEYLKIEVTRDYAKVIAEDGDQRNFCSISYSYRQENSAKFSEPVEILAADAESDTVQTEPLLNATFSKEYGYVVQIIAEDTAGQKTVSTVQIPCERIFRHKRAGGRGLGLGGYCDEDDLLDVHWNARVRKELRVDDCIVMKDTPLLELVYPVGSIYMSVLEVDPGVLFGGTWERLQDRFLLGASSTHTAGETDGEETHVLKTDEMPSHNHSERSLVTGHSEWDTTTIPQYSTHIPYDGGGYVGEATTVNAATVSSNTNTGGTGGGAAHNNMPPYLAVYMWKRTK